MFDAKTFLVAFDNDLCLSGGAKGADSQWGMTAGSAGHSVIHWSYGGHRAPVPEVELVRLTNEQLLVADPYLHTANKTLKRVVPTWKPWLCNLLRRNFYQVKWTQRVYAVGKFGRDGLVDGGTAWAVQMYLDRFYENDEPYEKCELYFYDQDSDNWLKWQVAERTWAVIDTPPKPHGVWTGIGTRELTDAGKSAIRALMEWKKPE